MDIQGYVNEVRALYASGQTTEHSFRPALAKLFQSIDPALKLSIAVDALKQCRAALLTTRSEIEDETRDRVIGRKIDLCSEIISACDPKIKATPCP